MSTTVKLCSNGPSCVHLARGLCRFNHPTETILCHFKDKCNKGAECKYFHPPTTELCQPVATTSVVPKKKLCKFFLKGTCTKEACPFDHPPATELCQPVATLVVPKKKPLCKFFVKGTCTKEACPFDHPTATVVNDKPGELLYPIAEIINSEATTTTA
jgi:hypothetical protein